MNYDINRFNFESFSKLTKPNDIQNYYFGAQVFSLALNARQKKKVC